MRGAQSGTRVLPALAAVALLLTGTAPPALAAAPPPSAAPSPKLLPAPVTAWPENIDGLPQTKTSGSAATLDVVTAYQNGGEVVSIYLFRPTNPNAALWFERADAILNYVWSSKGLNAGSTPEKFTIAGAASPNGLRRSYALAAPFTSTAVAVAEVDGWLIKVRSTSERLTPAEQFARLDKALAAMTITAATAPPHPLLLPANCPDAETSLKSLMSTVVQNPKPENSLASGVMLLGHAAFLTGAKDSLADTPDKYCRAKLGEGGPIGALYRPVDPAKQDWTILFADSGRSISGLETLLFTGGKTPDQGGMVTLNQLDHTSAVLFTTGIPAPEAAFGPVMRMIGANFTGGYSSVTYGTGNISVSMPEEKRKK